MRPLTLLSRAAYTLVGLVLALVLLVQFQQRLLRHRAEQLLSDFRTLQAHPGNFADLERLQRRWGAHGHFDGTCTKAACTYTIVLFDSGEAAWKFTGEVPAPVRWLYEKLGGRDAIVTTAIALTDDRIWAVDYQLMLSLPEAFITELHTGNRLLQPREDVGSNGAEISREYEIGRPGACTICIRFWTRFDYQTPPADFARLSDIHLDCITRSKPCMDVIDTAPVALEQYTLEHTAPDETAASQCAANSAQLAREADNALLLQVGKLEQHDNDNQLFSARVLQSLKRASAIRAGSHIQVAVFPAGPGPMKSARSRLLLSPGEQYIVFYSDEPIFLKQDTVSADACDFVPATDANLKAVAEGIALDYSHGETMKIVSWQ